MIYRCSERWTGTTGIPSVFKTETNTQTSRKSNKSSGKGSSKLGSNLIRYYSNQSWWPAGRVLSKYCSYISRRATWRSWTKVNERKYVERYLANRRMKWNKAKETKSVTQTVRVWSIQRNKNGSENIPASAARGKLRGRKGKAGMAERLWENWMEVFFHRGYKRTCDVN